MALLLKGNAIFLHVPKTGGNWVESVLHELGLIRTHLQIHARGDKHISLDDVGRTVTAAQKRQIKLSKVDAAAVSELHNAYLFAFVRHPLSWYESWFSYMSRPDRRWLNWGQQEHAFGVRHVHPCAPLNGLGSDDFNHFLENVLRRRPGWVTELYSWYTGSGVSFVGHQETLAEDLIKVLHNLGHQVDQPYIRARARHRQNRSEDYRAGLRWDPALREEIRAVEYAAIRRYGYADEPPGV